LTDVYRAGEVLSYIWSSNGVNVAERCGRGRVQPAWALAVVAAFILWTPSVAAAALPPAKPPTRLALKELGVRATWPVHQEVTTISPGRQVTVTIKRSRRATPRLALYRVDSSGRLISAAMGDRGRSGALSVLVPDRPDQRYQLRLTIGRARFWSWIQTPAAVPPTLPAPTPPAPPAPVTDPTPPPPPSPTPQPPAPAEPTSGVPGGPPVYVHPGLPCPISGGTAAATGTISSHSGHTGDPIVLTLTNTGDICLYDDLDSWFEARQPDGSWRAIAEPPPSQTDAPEFSGPQQRTDRTIGFMGATWTTQIKVWSTLHPGHYRLVKSLRTVNQPYVLTFDYDVLP
jgi:hypothetical protein